MCVAEGGTVRGILGREAVAEGGETDAAAGGHVSGVRFFKHHLTMI